MSKFWPLAVSSWGPRERAAARSVIDGDGFTMGTRVRELEVAFARHVGSRWAVMTNSGSSANLLAVAALRTFYSKKEVIVPAIAWSTTYAPLAQHGYRLVICDVDPETLNVDLAQVRTALSADTALIVGASILGAPAPLVELRLFADEQHIPLFEDNCESLGAKVCGQHCGTFGHVGTFSFFFSHHLSTGEGGMLVTDDDDLYDLTVCLRAHGWARDLRPSSPLRPITEASDLSGAYRFLLPGYNVRPTELAAAVGLVQLERLTIFELDRRANAELFHRLFDGDPRWRTQLTSEDDHAVPFGFTLVFRTQTERARASLALEATDIEHRLITGGSFTQHPAARYYYWRHATPSGTPHADAAHDRGLFVGNHAADLTAQITRLREILEEVIK